MCSIEKEIIKGWQTLIQQKNFFSERIMHMLQKIRFSQPEDVREFVDAASKCNFDIDISYGRITVDAKSIMGILGMDLAHALTVKCHGEDQEFRNTLKKWAVA